MEQCISATEKMPLAQLRKASRGPKDEQDDFERNMSRQNLQAMQQAFKKKKKMRYKDLTEGEILFQEGDKVQAEDIYMIEKGTLEVLQHDASTDGVTFAFDTVTARPATTTTHRASSHGDARSRWLWLLRSRSSCVFCVDARSEPV